MSHREKLLSLSAKLLDDGDKENGLFLQEIANDVAMEPAEDKKAKGEGLSDSEMSMLEYKLKKAHERESNSDDD